MFKPKIKKTKIKKKQILFLPLLILISNCTKAPHKDLAKSDKNSDTILTPQALVDSPNTQAFDQVIIDLQTEIKPMYQAPSLTVILMPKADLQQSIQTLLQKGGKLIYDPNFRNGNDIPFYIAELTPDQINDTEFMKSLKLKSASLDKVRKNLTPTHRIETNNNIKPTNFIPTDSVGIHNFSPEVRSELGEGTVVAVIDTGVDASHPAFNGRVDYWYDATEETKTKLILVKTDEEGKTQYKDQTVTLPKELAGQEVYLGILDEKSFFFQLSDENKSKKGFLDLNYNKTADQFLVALVKKDDQLLTLVDVNGDLKISEQESTPLVDYNTTSQETRQEGMVKFPTRNNIIQYPLLITQEGEDIHVGLGKTSGMHGTHVAGIIAAHDPNSNLIGVAPKARLMSLRVCSQISCTDSAIIKALYQSFYNGKMIPDVVNISLGSHEGYQRDLYAHLFNDLSAKFGTIFFISASNSGPGFRSLNHLGNSGAVVTVGANVSKQTLKDQYNLPEDAPILDENLLFFSSLGPSYTGEMKPNIIAPGGAISTVLAAEGYMSQANGTSMSSPLAAGVMSAVLSLVKKETPELLENLSQTRQARNKNQETITETLHPYSFAMRDALMLSAKRVPNLSLAQQGFGLIKAPKAKEKLTSLLSEMKVGERNYFEVAINDYQKGGFQREKLTEINAFKLTLAEDGERSKASTAKILSQGVKVQLDRVEEISKDGQVKFISKMEDYFYLIDLGNHQNKKRETFVAFNNRRNPTFYSKRNLSTMKPGFTYIAHYKIYAGMANVQNILDVVSPPLNFSHHKISLNSLDPSVGHYKSSILAKAQPIGVNQFHRYPIQVDSQTRELKISVAMNRDLPGRLYLQVYNPDGKEKIFKVANNTPVNGYSQIKINLSTLKDEKVQAGIWEVTLSTSSSAWLSKTEYDMAIQKVSFGFRGAKLQLAQKEQDKKVMLDLQHSELEQANIENFRMAKLEEIQVKSNHYSFHPLHLPKELKKLKIKIYPEDKDKDYYWGRIDHRLFEKVGEEFKSVKVKSETKGKAKVFSSEIDYTKQYYLALDTIQNFDLGTGIKKSKVQKTKIWVEYLNAELPKNLITSELENFTDHSVAMLMLKKEKGLKKFTDYFILSDLVLMDKDKQKQKVRLEIEP